MSLTERAREFTEQLARSRDDVEDEEPEPRGEHRVQRKDREEGGLITYLLGYRTPNPSTDAVDTLERPPPEEIDEYWQRYYVKFALTRAPLTIFDEAVVEPGYKIRVEDANGERDEDMEEALKFWAENCVIHAGETGHSLSKLLGSLPSKRRGKGTVLIEKVPIAGDPDSIAGLMSLPPSTFKILTRERQPILIQPDDDVDGQHPRTPDGRSAAYVQYHEDLTGYDDKEEIAFAADDIIKLTYDADDGEVWGRSVFEACDDRIDALIQKLKDRDYAIRQTGYAHRIYSSDSWSQKEAENYASAHKDGDVSAQYGPEGKQDRASGGEKTSFAGRVDFVPNTVNVQVESGEVPDLEGAIKDDIEQIFSVMPVSKFKIAYEEDINQFVVEPQADKDSMLVESERKYLEEKFEPVFQQKADELADADSYDGEIHFSIEPKEDENPLRRESFPAENLDALVSAFRDYVEGGVDMHLPPGAFAELAGFDLEELRDRHEWEVDPLELDDDEDTEERLDELESMIQEQQADDNDDDDDVGENGDLEDEEDEHLEA